MRVIFRKSAISAGRIGPLIVSTLFVLPPCHCNLTLALDTMAAEDGSRRGERSSRHRDNDGSSKHSGRSHRDSSRRDRSASPLNRRSPPPLPHGAPPLTADDYYARSYELKAYLATKSLFLDELASSSARRHFDRFVSKWNSARLPEDYYAGNLRSAGGNQTRHRWGFLGGTLTKGEREAMESVRDTVDTLTNGESRGAREARDAERQARSKASLERARDDGADNRGERDPGWSQRSHSERQMDREHARDMTRISQADAHRRARADATDDAEAIHGGRATGRDRAMEKRRERNLENRAFARRNDDGLDELDERELYDEPCRPTDTGGSGERRIGKREQARQERAEERRQELQERVGDLKRKEGATMDMFRAMAAERFGGGG